MALLELLNVKNRFSIPAPLIAIADEHKYVSRLLVLLEDEANHLKEGKPADFECMADIINYIVHYPDRYHHPKEELIFDRMVDADGKTQQIIKSLRRGHDQVASMGQDMADEIEATRNSRSKKKRLALAKNINIYVAGLREHIRLEETEIFAPAMSLLTKADWKAIDKEIAPIIDPVFGDSIADEYKALFGRYLNRVVTVSTGAIPPGKFELVASNIERTIYAAGEVRKLPGRLTSKTRRSIKEGLVLVKGLHPSHSRSPKKLNQVITALTRHTVSEVKSSFSMIGDAFLAKEPINSEEGEHVQFHAAASLSEEDDFTGFNKGKLHSGPISWQAVLANVLLRITIKQLMGHMGPDAAVHAKKLTFLTDKVPQGVDASIVDFDSFYARWLRPQGCADTSKTILYLPGGGFIFPASSGHNTILSTLAEKSGSQGLMVHYRLAPEHPFPAGLEDALAAYRYLLEDQGIAPSDIVVAGDSAGGGLTLSLMMAIRDEGLPMPKAVCVMSPLADLSFSGPSREFNRWRDPMLPTRREMNAFEIYAGDTPSNAPLLSPIYGDLSGLPPMFAQVGSTEILLDDTLRIAKKARSQGVEVEVEVWNSLPHVWHLWSFLPETEQALINIAHFFNKHLEQPKLQAA